MVASSPEKAVSNGHAVSSYDSGMCQMFVRGQCWQVGSLYGSAIEAWNGAKYKHPGDRTPPKGAPTYYKGGNYGHAVIFCGSGHTGIRSTDCSTAYKVNDTDIAWPERAWGYTYLGWTEDINGVRVIEPGGTEPPPDTGDEDMPEYTSASCADQTFNNEGNWQGVTWEKVAAGDAVKVNEQGFRIGGKAYVAMLNAQVSVDSGERIQTRTVEVEKNKDGTYTDIVETNKGVEHLRTSGDTFVQDTRVGMVGKDRALRFQIMVPANAKVTASVAIVCW
jgi:hypothetical protein